VAALHEASTDARAVAPPASTARGAADAAFARAANGDAAEAFTRDLATRRYENFSVATLLLPQALRQDFCNIYAFCRLADDLGDEIPDAAASLDCLSRFREALRACYRGNSDSAVFLALRRTIDRHDIPVDPFLDLISAFEQDQRVRRYDSYEQLLDYCRRSANPVGRLVLYVCGYRDAERQRCSDFTCTALQLANFWQDVARDLRDLDRIYIPRSSLEQFGVTEAQLRRDRADENVRELIRFEVDRTDRMFADGERLLPMLNPSVRGQITLFGMAGRAVLDAIRRQDCDTLVRRPVVSRWQKGRLIARAATSCLMGCLDRGAAL
jgi:squalene synthase HpnC